jgi:hypothetical protein
MGLLRRVSSGWLRIARLLGALALGIAVAGAVGALVVLPLWLLASKATAIYNVLVAILVAGLLIGRLIRLLQSQTSRSLLPILRKTGAVVAGLGGVYVFAILLWEGFAWAAVLVGLLYLVWIGAAFGRRRRHQT